MPSSRVGTERGKRERIGPTLCRPRKKRAPAWVFLEPHERVMKYTNMLVLFK